MLSAAEDSADSAESDATPSQLALIRLAYSQALNDVGRFSQAEQQLLRALPDLTGQERAFTLCARARAATRQGRNDEAIRSAEQAARWSEAHGDPWGRALALHQRSLAHWEHAPLQKVLEAQRAAHKAAQEAGDPHLLHLTQNNLAATLRKRGDYGSARELLTPLIDDEERANHNGKLIWPLINLGTLEKVEGDVEQAKLLLRRALDLALAKGAQHQAARARYCLAYALLAAGELDAARRHTSTALEVMSRLDDKAGTASARILKGEILEQRGELEAADREFRAAAEISEELGFTYGQTVVPVRRGILALRRGDPSTAARNLRRGLKLSGEYGPESVRQLALAGAARLLAEQEHGTAASAWLEAMRASPEVAPHVRQEIETWDLPCSDGDASASYHQAASLDELQLEIEAGLASFVEGV